jgi:hypothetical protein
MSISISILSYQMYLRICCFMNVAYNLQYKVDRLVLMQFKTRWRALLSMSHFKLGRQRIFGTI